VRDIRLAQQDWYESRVRRHLGIFIAVIIIVEDAADLSLLHDSQVNLMNEEVPGKLRFFRKEERSQKKLPLGTVSHSPTSNTLT